MLKSVLCSLINFVIEGQRPSARWPSARWGGLCDTHRQTVEFVFKCDTTAGQ